MDDKANIIFSELRHIRKGSGLQSPSIENQIGPGLRELGEIDADDQQMTVRAKLREKLLNASRDLPSDLRVAATVALAIHEEAQSPFLLKRLDWLASRFEFDVRTARRRVDEGLMLLATSAASQLSRNARGGEIYDDWYVEDFQAILRMDQESPEAIELRRIVANSDTIDHIDIQMSLPPAQPGADNSRDLSIEVLYGGALVLKERKTDSIFRFILELPTTIQYGERHDYAILFRLPRHQPMRSHYVFTSPRRCDSFGLRIRFEQNNRPQQIWRVNAALPRAVDEAQPDADEIITLNKANELHVQFSELRQGLGYGVKWN